MAYIIINNKTYEATVTYCASDYNWDKRPVKIVRLYMTPAYAAAVFIDGAAWSIVNADGIAVDQATYAKAGTITDNRDGTVTVKMGAYTAEELTSTAYGEVPRSMAEAESIRPVARRLAASATDQEAVAVRMLYPTWDELVAAGQPVEPGTRLVHGRTLYKVVQAHTPAAAWMPGVVTASLYTVIDEEHAGTVSDPIPYTSGMELSYGKVYSEGGVLYRCIRDTEGVAIYHALAELVGNYVEVV
jgi:hypothetical protein